MPIIDGQKVACEPCIRGHRSTKCNHAKERLMVPVRKPGRPLSVCPHPPNKLCGCRGVTAALPRTQKCGCGSGPAVSTTGQSTAESPSIKPQGSPTRRAFHVHKPGAKSVMRIEPTGLERTDINNLNVHPPPSWAAAPVPYPNGGFVLPVQTPPTSTAFQPGVHNGFPHHAGVDFDSPYLVAPMPLPPAAIKPAPAQHAIPDAQTSSDGTNGASPDGTAVTQRSCCAPVSPRHTPSSSTASVAASVATSKTASCCSATTDPEAGENHAGLPGHGHVADELSRRPLHSPNGTGGPTFGQAMGMPLFPAYYQPPGPALYTYPAPYGTLASPLQPDQWRHTMAMFYDQNMPENPISLPPGAVLAPPFAANRGAPGPGTSHMCSCGDSCNCLGCPAHPYNEVTQNYVRSAMSSMMEPPPPPPSHHGTTDAYPNGVSGAADEAESPTSQVTAATTATTAAREPASPQQAQTPSDASGLSEDQTQLSASDFFFVTYPFGHCGGEVMSCPCGDECQCVGCLIHNNPGPDEE